MKKIKQKIGKLLVLAFILLTIFGQAQANCTSYLIKNITGCVIVFDVQSYCNGSPSSCGSVSGQSLGAGGQYTITGCSGCSSCDYDVILQSVGGNTTGLPVNVISSSPNSTYPTSNCPGNCNGIFKWKFSETTVD